MTICDPACGTGGFLLAAHDYIADAQHYQLDPDAEAPSARSARCYGVEIVDNIARLCCMNLLLHGIGGDGAEPVPIEARDSLGRATAARSTTWC